MEKRLYKATFIVNLRETKRQIPAIVEWLKKVIAEVGGKVEGTEDLGVRNFAYVTQKQNPNGHYLTITFSANGDVNTALQQKLKLETEIKRAFVESVEAKPAKA